MSQSTILLFSTIRRIVAHTTFPVVLFLSLHRLGRIDFNLFLPSSHNHFPNFCLKTRTNNHFFISYIHPPTEEMEWWSQHNTKPTKEYENKTTTQTATGPRRRRRVKNKHVQSVRNRRKNLIRKTCQHSNSRGEIITSFLHRYMGKITRKYKFLHVNTCASNGEGRRHHKVIPKWSNNYFRHVYFCKIYSALMSKIIHIDVFACNIGCILFSGK